MKDLATALSAANAAVFTELGLDPKHADVRRSDRPDLGEFQCNGALAVAKAVAKKPQEVAQSVAAHWAATDLAAAPTIAGPGFLNFTVTPEALAKRAQFVADDEMAGASPVEHKRRVVVDYGGPNVAKGMHVGHLRASIIGESVKRIYRFRGDEVWGDAHFGDWGFQMGLVITALEDELGGFEDRAKLDARLQTLTLEQLEAIYPAYAAKVRDGDTDVRDRARSRAVHQMRDKIPGRSEGLSGPLRRNRSRGLSGGDEGRSEGLSSPIVDELVGPDANARRDVLKSILKK